MRPVRWRGGRHLARVAVAGVLACLLAPGAGTLPAAAAQANQWWHGLWRMDDVWQVTDGSGVTVAVIDGGVDATVPELAGAVLAGTDLAGQGTDGTVDLSDGHGTRVASLIAARDIGQGMVGVAPGVRVLPVVASGEATGEEVAIDVFHRWVAEGIRYAVDHGAHVINVSLGALNLSSGDYPCPPVLVDAIRYAVGQEVVTVASAGNVAGGWSEAPGSCPGVLTVGAVDADLAVWEDSHRSPYVDVAAPGVDIPAVSAGGEIRYVTGTSVATALVSGAVALARAEFPDASARELVTRVIGTAVDVGPDGPDDATGYGVVAPLGALTLEVPEGVPNPAFDALEALPDGATEGPPSAGGAPELSRPQVPPAAEETSPADRLVLVLVLAGMGALLVGLLALVAGLLIRQRRAAQRQYAGPPGPPGGPAAPPGPPPPDPSPSWAPPPGPPPPEIPARFRGPPAP